MGRYLRRSLASASLLSIVIATAAQAAPAAESATSTGVNTLSEVVVTARRKSELLQDVPLVVNAVTAHTLQQDNIRNFQDITTVVPGLSLVPNANGIGTSSSMRGVNHDVNVSGDAGTIQYYLDDAPVGSDLIFQTMFDVSQIEVERGPQGTLRGRATPSGSITVATTKPNLREMGGYVDGTLGSAATSNINAAVNFPIIPDKLAVRIGGVYDFNRGDRVTSINNPALPHNKTEAFRVSVRFEPTDFAKFGFSYLGINHDTAAYDQAESFNIVNPGFTASANAPNYGTITLHDRKAVEAVQRRFTQDVKHYGWNGQFSFAGQDLFYVGSYADTKYHPITPQDLGNIFPALSVLQNTRTEATGWTHELRLQNSERVFGMFDYVAGYFYDKGEPVTNLTNGSVVELFVTPFPGFTIPVPPGFVPGGKNPFAVNTAIKVSPGTATEESFFGNLTMHIGDKTELAGGGRRISYISSGGDLFINGRFAAPGNAVNETDTIYNATLRHQFTNNVMVYASTGSSFRPGVFAIGDFTSVPYSPNELAHLKLNPETSTSYEAGLKSQWLDDKILLNVTYYHQDFHNYPFRAAGNGIYYINFSSSGAPTVGNFNFVSAVPVEVNGVEGEVGYRPTPSLNIDATVNWSQSKIGNALLACDGLPNGIVPTLAQLQAALGSEHLGVCPGGGQPANFQPDWSGSVTAEYTRPLNGTMDGYVRGLVSWKGASRNDPNNPYDSVSAYGIFNLYAGVRDHRGAWQIALYGKNIGNVEKIATLNGTPFSISPTNVNITTGVISSSTFSSPYTGVTMTPPEEFGVNLRYAWGSR